MRWSLGNQIPARERIFRMVSFGQLDSVLLDQLLARKGRPEVVV
jgi:hypothetical protein